MEIKARAKINWTLDVVGKRADGYHLLDTLMQPLELCDLITIEPDAGLSLTLDSPVELSAGEDNLMLRAARALQAYAGVAQGARMRLLKRIPMGAGLGGGSADAAAVLKGLNILWSLGLSLDALCEIGVKLGADIPFCLHDAPRRAQGIGERLTPFPCKRRFPLLVVQPCAALSTKAVFSAYSAVSPKRPDTPGALRALAAGDLPLLSQCAANVLEEASLPMRPEIGAAKAALLQAGAVMAQMTGSGSAVFGAFEAEAQAAQAQALLQRRFTPCLLTSTEI